MGLRGAYYWANTLNTTFPALARSLNTKGIFSGVYKNVQYFDWNASFRMDLKQKVGKLLMHASQAIKRIRACTVLFANDYYAFKIYNIRCVLKNNYTAYNLKTYLHWKYSILYKKQTTWHEWWGLIQADLDLSELFGGWEYPVVSEKCPRVNQGINWQDSTRSTMYSWFN